MSEVTLNVKVQGLEQLRETVALLKELKELGAGNPDILAEIHVDGAVVPKVLVQEEKPWYPNDMPWVEHDGNSLPPGEKFHMLLRDERDTKDYCDGGEHYIGDWVDEFLWKSRNGDDVVAYIKVED